MPVSPGKREKQEGTPLFQKPLLPSTPEQCIVRLGESRRLSHQSVMDVSEFSCKALNVGVWGRLVSDFTELSDLLYGKHRFSNHFSELHQHPVDVSLPHPREFDQGEDQWLSARVSQRVPMDGPREGGPTPPREGGGSLGYIRQEAPRVPN